MAPECLEYLASDHSLESEEEDNDSISDRAVGRRVNLSPVNDGSDEDSSPPWRGTMVLTRKLTIRSKAANVSQAICLPVKTRITRLPKRANKCKLGDRSSCKSALSGEQPSSHNGLPIIRCTDNVGKPEDDSQADVGELKRQFSILRRSLVRDDDLLMPSDHANAFALLQRGLNVLDRRPL